jgi:enamine deaminase RidA (YjgF/YER057c/UK114 family)
MHVQHLSSPAFAQMGLPFSEMVRVGDMLHLSGQMGTLPGQVKLVQGGVAAEARQALANIRDALEHQGYSLRPISKIRVKTCHIDKFLWRARLAARYRSGTTSVGTVGNA